MPSYQAVIGLKNVGTPTDSYEEVLRLFLGGVRAGLKEGQGPMWLYEMCYITRNGLWHRNFESARDDAYDLGVLKDGKLVEKGA